MKNLIRVMAVVATLLSIVSTCQAKENFLDGQLHYLKASYYNDNEQLTSTGTVPTEGRTCAFGSGEYAGCAVLVWEDIEGKQGELLGIYIVEDTGGKLIKNCERIDIWFDGSDEELMEMGLTDVIIQVVKGQG